MTLKLKTPLFKTTLIYLYEYCGTIVNIYLRAIHQFCVRRRNGEPLERNIWKEKVRGRDTSHCSREKGNVHTSRLGAELRWHIQKQMTGNKCHLFLETAYHLSWRWNSPQPQGLWPESRWQEPPSHPCIGEGGRGSLLHHDQRQCTPRIGEPRSSNLLVLRCCECLGGHGD